MHQERNIENEDRTRADHWRRLTSEAELLAVIFHLEHKTELPRFCLVILGAGGWRAVIYLGCCTF
jgi:hypothetical protein